MTIWYGELSADAGLPGYNYDPLNDGEIMELDLSSDDEYSADEDLLPGLPEDLAIECLLRVSFNALPQLQGVCRKWGSLVASRDFYEERKRLGTTHNCVCMVQALPQVPTEGDPQEGTKHEPAPVFGVSVYDWQQQQGWTRLPPIPDFPNGLPLFCRIVGVDRNLVVLGGWHPETWDAIRNVYMYDFTTQTWKRCADMPTARSFYACGVVGGSHIFVAGGHDDSKDALASAEAYSVAEDRWEVLPNMSEQRDECGGVGLDGKFVVISGYATNAQGQFVSSAESYDPAYRSWTRLEGMWMEGVNPGPFVVSQGQQQQQQLHALQRQNVLRYRKEDNSWIHVDTIPNEGEVAMCATAVCDSILIMTSPTSDDRNKSLIHSRRLDGKGAWQRVNTSEKFCGLGRACCIVEV